MSISAVGDKSSLSPISRFGVNFLSVTETTSQKLLFYNFRLDVGLSRITKYNKYKVTKSLIALDSPSPKSTTAFCYLL